MVPSLLTEHELGLPSLEIHVPVLQLLAECLVLEEVVVALQYLKVTDWEKVLR